MRYKPTRKTDTEYQISAVRVIDRLIASAKRFITWLVLKEIISLESAIFSIRRSEESQRAYIEVYERP